jgi:DNA-binding transcriptional regulator YbjK
VDDTSRRTRLADAAIATLAREGSRGLTHRAVDRAAGVAEGSTSYYFRTRHALLNAIVARMSSLDAASIPTLAHASGEEFADAFAAVVHGLLTEGRDRQLARYELALEGTRRPDLRRLLHDNAAPVEERFTEQFTALGVPDPRERARDFLVLVEGLLFSRLTATEDLPSPSALRSIVGRMLRAVDVPH